jgi:hypothetical protein
MTRHMTIDQSLHSTLQAVAGDDLAGVAGGQVEGFDYCAAARGVLADSRRVFDRYHADSQGPGGPARTRAWEMINNPAFVNLADLARGMGQDCGDWKK